MTNDSIHLVDDSGYMDNLPHQIKKTFFDELAKYSAREIANYFDKGIVAVNNLEELGGVSLPRDNLNHAREIVHVYLMGTYHHFQEKVRGHLERELVDPDLELDLILLPSGTLIEI